MAYTPNQITDVFQSALGRAPTAYELTTYKNASPQTLATVKDTYSKYNTSQSITDYLKYTGTDPSTISDLAKAHGITNVGTAEGNLALLKSLKNGTPVAAASSIPGKLAKPQSAPLADAITDVPKMPPESGPGSKDPSATPAQDSTPAPAPGDFGDVNSKSPNPVQSSNTPPALPQVSAAKDAYVSAQKAVSDVSSRIAAINASIDASLENKKNEVAASGGVVDESQLRSIVLAENAPLIHERNTLMAQRTQLSGEQSSAGKAYQDAMNMQKESDANFYKSKTIEQNQEKIDNQKSQFDDKLASSNIVKESVYSDGSKVGEKFVDKTTGQEVKVDPKTGEKIGSGYSVGGAGSSIVSATNGKIKYTDFAAVPDAPTDENRNTVYPGTGGKTYGAVYEDAVTYAETGKYQKIGTSTKPSSKAYDDAVKQKAANIAAALGMTEDQLKIAYKGNSAAMSKLILLKSTIGAFENRAKSQIDLILNGYKDPITGKTVASLNDSVSRTDYPIVNGMFVAGKIQAGDTSAKLLSNALLTFTAEYAKIMSGGTGSSAASSDTAREEASSLISTALSNGTLSSVLGLLQKELDTTIAGYDKQIQETGMGMSITGTGKDAGGSANDPLNLGL